MRSKTVSTEGKTLKPAFGELVNCTPCHRVPALIDRRLKDSRIMSPCTCMADKDILYSIVLSALLGKWVSLEIKTVHPSQKNPEDAPLQFR